MLIFVSIAAVTLFIFAALVIDIGMLRIDRRTDRVSADAAASAGVMDLDPFAGGDGATACATAWGYLMSNLPDAQTGSPSPDCSGFAGVCNPAVARTVTASVGDYTLHIVQPVPDGHGLMAGQDLNPVVDGGACQRLGVRIERGRDFSFAQLIGINSGETDVSAVARIGVGLGDPELVPLLLLEPFACNALVTAGQGRVTVDSFEDTPGYILVDSDASGGQGPLKCGNNNYTIDVFGTENGWIRALPTDEGLTSAILSYALSGATGASPADAYDPKDLLTPIAGTQVVDATGPPESLFRLYPTPFPLSRRITRGPIDWRYNCKKSYPDYDVNVPVAGCLEAATGTPHIDNLVSDYSGVGTPSGSFQQWSVLYDSVYPGDDPCHTQSGDDISVTGDVWIDCDDFDVSSNIMFAGGSIVSDGPIRVGSQGSLTINASPSGDELVYIRDGGLRKGAQATLTMLRTFVYLEDGEIDLGGGAGALSWSAPLAGRFEDLALWSESRDLHRLTGQSNTDLEGTLFTPNADPFELTGLGGQFQVEAQFLTRRLVVKGQGIVNMEPSPDRSTLIPVRDLLLIR